VCKKLIKNSQPFGKKFQKTVGGDFFDSHCREMILACSTAPKAHTWDRERETCRHTQTQSVIHCAVQTSEGE